MPSRSRTRRRRSSSVARRDRVRALAARIGDGWSTFDDNFEAHLPVYLEALEAAGRSRDDQTRPRRVPGQHLGQGRQHGPGLPVGPRPARGVGALARGRCGRRDRDRPHDRRRRRARRVSSALVATLEPGPPRSGQQPVSWHHRGVIPTTSVPAAEPSPPVCPLRCAGGAGCRAVRGLQPARAARRGVRAGPRLGVHRRDRGDHPAGGAGAAVRGRARAVPRDRRQRDAERRWAGGHADRDERGNGGRADELPPVEGRRPRHGPGRVRLEPADSGPARPAPSRP